MLTNTKAAIAQKFAAHETDTGSSAVQIALMTDRINSLTDHFKTHKKDHHSRRGLLKLVAKRRNMLRYLHNKDLAAYKKVIADLGLRK